MADKPKTQMEEIEQILNNEDQYYPPEEDLLRGGKEPKSQVEKLKQIKTPDSEEVALAKKVEKLSKQVQAMPERRNIREEYLLQSDKLKRLRDEKAEEKGSKEETPPSTPSTPLPPTVLTAKSETRSKPIGSVDSLEKSMSSYEDKLDSNLAQLRSGLQGRIDKRDMIQAWGNVLVDLFQWARLAGAPKGAIQPAIKMSRIDFSKLNDRDMKSVIGQMGDLKDELKRLQSQKQTDIITQRQGRSLENRSEKQSQDDKDRIAKLNQINKAEISAIKNIDDEKKIVNELASAGMDLDVADKMVNKWYRVDLDKKEKLQVIRNFFEARRQQLGAGGSETTQPQTRVINGATYMKVQGGWQKVK